MKTTIKVPEQLTRAAQITVTGEGDAREFSMSISSDEPYKRYDYWNDKEYYEVLDHGPGGVSDARLKAGLPILFNHDKNQHLGRATSYTNDGKKCSVSGLIWSESEFAQTKKKDALSGALPDTSVGYRILGEGKQIGTKDGIPILRFKWEIHEASLVTIPADITVGVGRDAGEIARLRSLPHSVIAIDLQKEIDGEGEKVQTQPTCKKHMAETSTQTEPVKQTVDLVAERTKWEAENQKRAKEINDFCEVVADKRKIDVRPLAKEYLFGEKRGKSFDDFRQEVFVGEFKAVPANTTGEIPGVTQKEVRQFSLMKAIRELADGGGMTGLEKEMCEAARKEMHITTTKAGEFVVPAEITRQGQLDAFQSFLMARGMAAQRFTRGQSASVFSEGGATVANEMQGLIEYLRNRTCLGRAGITVLSGLVGDLVFPVQTGGATAYWVSETGALTDSAATFGNKTMTPHRVGATIPLTTQILAQSSIPMEAWVRNELDTVVNLKVDAAGLHGTGASGEPLGIQNTTGINATVTFSGAADWADVVEFETGINVDNADIGTMKFLLSSATVGKWKTKLRDSVAGAAYLIQDGQSINGYSYERTNQITGNIAFFGVWSQLLQGRWAGRTLIVDPYALKKSGQIEVTVNEMVDYLCRQPLAFNVSTDSAAQ